MCRRYEDRCGRDFIFGQSVFSAVFIHIIHAKVLKNSFSNSTVCVCQIVWSANNELSHPTQYLHYNQFMEVKVWKVLYHCSVHVYDQLKVKLISPAV